MIQPSTCLGTTVTRLNSLPNTLIKDKIANDNLFVCILFLLLFLVFVVFVVFIFIKYRGTICPPVLLYGLSGSRAQGGQRGCNLKKIFIEYVPVYQIYRLYIVVNLWTLFKFADNHTRIKKKTHTNKRRTGIPIIKSRTENRLQNLNCQSWSFDPLGHKHITSRQKNKNNRKSFKKLKLLFYNILLEVQDYFPCLT